MTLRLLAPVLLGAIAGTALAAVIGAVLITFPETLLHLDDAVYDEHGHYVGMR